MSSRTVAGQQSVTNPSRRVISLLLLSIAIVACGGEKSTTEPEPPKPASLYFVGERPPQDGRWLQRIDVLGGAPVVVTQVSSFITGLAVSPDGSHLAVTDFQNVWTFGPDGSGVHQFAASGSQSPSFTPAGTQLYFALDRRLATSALDGSGLQTFGEQVVSDPVLSPNGIRVALSMPAGQDAGHEIFLTSTTASDAKRVRTGTLQPWNVQEMEPAWSPEGTKLVFVHADAGSHLYLVNADGSGLQQLTSGVPDDRTPSWSPDGKQIAFARQTTSSTLADIFVLTLETGAIVNVTNTPNAWEGFPRWVERH